MLERSGTPYWFTRTTCRANLGTSPGGAVVVNNIVLGAWLKAQNALQLGSSSKKYSSVARVTARAITKTRSENRRRSGRSKKGLNGPRHGKLEAAMATESLRHEGAAGGERSKGPPEAKALRGAAGGERSKGRRRRKPFTTPRDAGGESPTQPPRADRHTRAHTGQGLTICVFLKIFKNFLN